MGATERGTAVNAFLSAVMWWRTTEMCAVRSGVGPGVVLARALMGFPCMVVVVSWGLLECLWADIVAGCKGESLGSFCACALTSLGKGLLHGGHSSLCLFFV